MAKSCKPYPAYYIQAWDEDEDCWLTIETVMSDRQTKHFRGPLKVAEVKAMDMQLLEGVGNVRVIEASSLVYGSKIPYVAWPEAQRWFIEPLSPKRLGRAMHELHLVPDSHGLRPRYKYGARTYLVRDHEDGHREVFDDEKQNWVTVHDPKMDTYEEVSDAEAAIIAKYGVRS